MLLEQIEELKGDMVGFSNTASFVFLGSAFQDEGEQPIRFYLTLVQHLVDFIGQAGGLQGETLSRNRFRFGHLRIVANR